MQINRIDDGKILIFGDLHFSDVYTGKHKDYLSNCCNILHKIELSVEEHKPSACIFAGDLVGWIETNVKSREVFSLFCSFWKRLNEKCIVYAVRGNHDMKGYPDFNFLVSMDIIKTPKTLDYYKEGQHCMRLHLVSYGEEHNPLDLAMGVSNIVIGHNNFMINGVTTWYTAGDGIEVSSLENFCGVDLIISGHIHVPSPELYSVTMRDGKPCGLFYVGSPTRIRETYDACWIASLYGVFENDKYEAEFDPIYFDLGDAKEIFYRDDEFVEDKTHEEIEDEIRRKNLAATLDDILKYRLFSGDPRQQVEMVTDAKPEAKALAIQYLEYVMRGEKNE